MPDGEVSDCEELRFMTRLNGRCSSTLSAVTFCPDGYYSQTTAEIKFVTHPSWRKFSWVIDEARAPVVLFEKGALRRCGWLGVELVHQMLDRADRVSAFTSAWGSSHLSLGTPWCIGQAKYRILPLVLILIFSTTTRSPTMGQVMELTQVATIVFGTASNILTCVRSRSCKIYCSLHEVGFVGLISGHKQHGPNISFVDRYCLMASGVIRTGLRVGLWFRAA